MKKYFKKFSKKHFENFWKNIWKVFDKKFGNFLKKYLENLKKILEPKVFYDISQSAVPSKHHKSYGKSFKKFAGGVVACLIIVSLQVLESDLELDNRDNVIQKHDPQK